MQFGDVSAYLGMEPKGTIVDLLQEQSNPNADTIRQFLALHVSGISFLPAPVSPEDAKAVSPSQADRIIAALRVYYDYVIVDTAPGFDDITTVCIDCSSQILLVTGNDIPSLRDTKKCLLILQALTEQEKIRLIVGCDTDFFD
jgi:pilus assembly protein CpaE